MNFCPNCESILRKIPTISGDVLFECHCEYKMKGGPDDTLFAEKHYSATQSSGKYDTMVENAPFDHAARRAKQDCPNCGLDFLTMVRVGEQETTLYVCSCGYRATYTEHMRAK